MLPFLPPTGMKLLNDPEIDVIVELIDDVQAAYEIVTGCTEKEKGCCFSQ